MKTHPEDDPVQPGSIVSPKLDGIYARATKEGMFTKSDAPITTQPHLVRRLKLHFLLHPKSELRGELYRHGQPFDQTLSDFRGGKGKLQYHLFPGAGPKPLPVFGIRRIRSQRVRSTAEADAHYRAAIESGYEGQIVETPAGEVAKRKPMHDEEYKVVAAAKGKKHGILTVQDEAGTPFRVQVPARVADQQPIGKSATVRYVKKTRNGVPHAPVFKSVRDWDMSAVLRRCIELNVLLDAALNL